MLTLTEIRNTKPLTPTSAMQAAEERRDLMNAGREKLVAPNYSCVVYFYELNGVPCSIGYKGRSKKASFHYRHKSSQDRSAHAEKWINAHTSITSQAKQATVRDLQVGDVLTSVWGYEQTNVNYYMVTRLVGEKSVELVEIGRFITATDRSGGQCVPDKTKILSEPFVRRANTSRVRIDSVQSARKADSTLVDGIEVYTPSSWSSYG